MRYRLIFAVLITFLSCSGAAAQMSGETEAGSDGKGGSFVSQYLYYDFPRLNLLGRYFWVKGVLQRGEFALGPTLQLNKTTTVKLQFGGTTEQDVMVAGVILAKVKKRDAIYIGDAKLSTTAGHPSTFYQKAFFAFNEKGTWLARVEDLQAGEEQNFLRIGVKYQLQLHNNQCHFYLAPFYDPLVQTAGGQIGFRFFGLRPHL